VLGAFSVVTFWPMVRLVGGAIMDCELGLS